MIRTHPSKRHKTPNPKCTPDEKETAPVGGAVENKYLLPPDEWGHRFGILLPIRINLKRATYGETCEHVVSHSETPQPDWPTFMITSETSSRQELLSIRRTIIRPSAILPSVCRGVNPRMRNIRPVHRAWIVFVSTAETPPVKSEAHMSSADSIR